MSNYASQGGVSIRGNPPKSPRAGYTAGGEGASWAGLKRTVRRQRRAGAMRTRSDGARIGNH